MPSSPVPPPSPLAPPAFLRRLRIDEAPYPGGLHAEPVGDGDLTLVRRHTVWVDLELVPDEAWHCDPDGHVLTPLDIARVGRGHAAIVPHCPERLADVCAASVTPGEAVTVVVSMLRAAVEARGRDIDHGTWWIDETGRPLLAAGGARLWADEVPVVVDRLIESVESRLRDAIGSAVAVMLQHRPTETEVESCEEALFAAAEPSALPVRGHAASVAASVLAVGASAPRRAATLRSAASTPHPAVTGTTARKERRLAAVMAAAVAGRVEKAYRAVAALPGRLRAARRATEAAPHQLRRRAPWLVAATVAGLVLAGGLLWPDPDPATSADAPPGVGATGTTPTPVTAGDTATGSPEPTTTAGDVSGAGAAVIAGLSACAATGSACADLREDPGAPMPDGAVTSAATGRTASLLDEYGGVAVYRVEATDAPAQILVLVSADGKWLVRDVYDVADQP